ncbi:MAG: pyrroline-5-carboxylate reductase, partial [Candidatus Methanomethyliaceae archaeon]|nr:pyrroline-5-carboxylate reductase [Candidatus Methanomethyliaceae archaeon]
SDLNVCDIIIIAVKPKDFAMVLEEIRKNLDGNKIFISIAAGITISFMESKLGKNAKIIRAMPNIAASIGESISILIRNANVTNDEINLARRIFESVGMVFFIDDENIMDVITGISGSGPAYFFLIMKIMTELGEEFGLSKEMARKLVAQTCKAAGILALNSKEDFQSLINLVASPGGTTEEAINVMISKGLPEIFRNAIIAAIEKSKKLAIH